MSEKIASSEERFPEIKALMESKDDFDMPRTIAEIKRLLEFHDKHQWQPIETAPKDGTEILAYDRIECKILFWSGKTERIDIKNPAWVSWEFDNAELMTSYNPTHWMPLPEGPK